ncbi:SMP-30/gluconolactonase/LRE family protein [Salinibacterium sp. G-O1]|uniref:SMP-30/gluconolactonase/LRE family protein n=1 Tax=Salinibacterium sp. G-O1 TaxID=3046208 RepID=UPI0024B8A33D|nr:SMP-30/gluconolactonase/LRE family protein [Salinibacterium sp. G-O1]MDJ0334934.1 SMP-30/gluconolactonase/LRE family protein [Salinibacterium sp. G-O1]
MIYYGTPATQATYDLAEGILWDDLHGVIRWVDIREGRVLSGELRGGRLSVLESISIGETAGAVALADDGGQLVAAARGLATISPSGEVSIGPDLIDARPGVRLNDGTADMFGAFIVGTLTVGGDTGKESLMRISPDGTVEVLREGIRLSNGIAFSPDGNTIYHVDTLAKTVSSHSYGPGTFDVREPWVTVLDETHLPEYPDGLVVDSDGMLWIAQFGGSSVRRHSPAGELLDVVEVDALQVTCPGFVGPNLDRLAITTGIEGAQTTDNTGAIFVADVGATGLPAHRWAGSTTNPYWLLPDNERSPS